MNRYDREEGQCACGEWLEGDAMCPRCRADVPPVPAPEPSEREALAKLIYETEGLYTPMRYCEVLATALLAAGYRRSRILAALRSPTTDPKEGR